MIKLAAKMGSWWMANGKIPLFFCYKSVIIKCCKAKKLSGFNLILLHFEEKDNSAEEVIEQGFREVIGD